MDGRIHSLISCLGLYMSAKQNQDLTDIGLELEELQSRLQQLQQDNPTIYYSADILALLRRSEEQTLKDFEEWDAQHVVVDNQVIKDDAKKTRFAIWKASRTILEQRILESEIQIALMNEFIYLCDELDDFLPETLAESLKELQVQLSNIQVNPMIKRIAERAFEDGWRTASNWVERDDLIQDIGSPAYDSDKEDAMERLFTYLSRHE